MTKEKVRAAVYGSGVSGLITSFCLVEKGFSVDVIDPFNKPILQTVKTEHGLVELGANSILYNDEVEELLKTINLKPVFYSDLGKKKFIYIDEQVKRWPLTIWQTLKNFKTLNKLRKKDLSLKPFDNETLSEWGARCLSKELYHNILAVAFQGIYGANTGSLSATLVLKSFFDKGKKTSVKGSVSFENGMSDFTKSLRAYLESKEVNFLSHDDSENNYKYKFVCAPSYSLPDFLDEKLKKTLSQVKYKKVSTMTLFFKDEDRVPFKGFGCVFKKASGVLGLILNTDLFPGRARDGFVSETWILNGETFNEESSALREVLNFRESKLQGGASTPAGVHFKYWSNAFPNYNITLENTLKDIYDENNVYFFGNWTGDLGIGSMIKNFKKRIERIVNKEEI